MASLKRPPKGSFLKGIAAMFPYLAQFALTFSIVMIVLEIVVGIMLILGQKPRLTAWLYLLIMVFFTILTGYTHLTGYVPSGVNFFEFSKWGEYIASNMKVTDCGCFGDFLKLSPTTSFYKDCALMPVALILLFFSKKWHKIGVNAIGLAFSFGVNCLLLV
ncbi:MAG: DoxX family protein [Saprospiraceae bacterium]|nr:DoxX family protein [Saprospiraceae bacterium]